MTACPACAGTGREPIPRKLLVVWGRRFGKTVDLNQALTRLPECKACRGSGRLVDVLLR